MPRRRSGSPAGIALEGKPRRALQPPGADVFAQLPDAVERLLSEPWHRQQAERVAAGQVGYGVRVPQHHGEDVAARGIGERMKERVGPFALARTYNH